MASFIRKLHFTQHSLNYALPDLLLLQRQCLICACSIYTYSIQHTAYRVASCVMLHAAPRCVVCTNAYDYMNFKSRRVRAYLLAALHALCVCHRRHRRRHCLISALVIERLYRAFNFSAAAKQTRHRHRDLRAAHVPYSSHSAFEQSAPRAHTHTHITAIQTIRVRVHTLHSHSICLL